MGHPRKPISNDVIIFHQPGAQELIDSLPDRSDGSAPPSERTLLEGNDWAQIETDTPMSRPEEQPTYEAPLTVEVIVDQYSHAVSLETGEALFTTVPGSEKFDQTIQNAASEITQHYLWRLGLPSELEAFVDINNEDTREILQQEYDSIPEATRRDNNTNAFDRRWGRIKDHLVEDCHVDPKELQDKVDVWREDLSVRLDVTAEDTKPETDLEEVCRPGSRKAREQLSRGKLGGSAVSASEDR